MNQLIGLSLDFVRCHCSFSRGWCPRPQWILRGDTFPKRCHLFNPGVTESIPFVYFNSLSLRPKMFFFTGRPDGHKVSQRIAVVGTNREKMNSGTEQNLSSTLSADSSKNLIILVIDGLKLNPPCYLI